MKARTATENGVVSPLAAALRRYSYAYTAVHDLAVCDDLMVEDYRLVMGPFVAQGRDDSYKPAAVKQFDQFPGLGFTVHDLVLGHDRAALHFTEHGRSMSHGRTAAWSGVSLYRWDGQRLLECRVEQDYFARRGQLRGETAAVLSSPAVDPWTQVPAGHDDAVAGTARRWLTGGGLVDLPQGALDDERHRPMARVWLDDVTTDVLDLFAAGDRAAFHVALDGRYAGGLPGRDTYTGRSGRLYAAGVLTVAGDEVTSVSAVSDRLAFERRLSEYGCSDR